MQLALECPTPLLSEIQPLADFDFCLSHLVLKDEEYANYYRKSNRVKILDNSTNELLSPLSLEEIKQAADIVKPNFVVAPDFLGDGVTTIESLKKALHYWDQSMLIPVIQGSTIQEVINCLKEIVRLNFCARLAVPFDILTNRSASLEDMAKGRRMVIHMLDMSYTQYPIDSIHLLGVTTLEELKSYDTYPQVESVDTGSPVLHGLKGLRYGRDRLLDKSTPTMNRMPNNYILGLENIYYNISYLRKYTSGAGL